MSVDGVHRADHYGNLVKEYEMGGTLARRLKMNTENSIRKEIGRLMFRLEDNIKMYLKGILCENVERIRLGKEWGSAAGFCECGNELSGFSERQYILPVAELKQVDPS
jgi:hypothetical protein